MDMVIVNYRGVITGVPMLPIHWMGFALYIALVRVMAIYETL